MNPLRRRKRFPAPTTRFPHCGKLFSTLWKIRFRPVCLLPTVLLIWLPFRPAVAQSILEEMELDTEWMTQTGQALFDQFAPAAIREKYEFASPADMANAYQAIQRALSGEGLDALADLQPLAAQSLEALRLMPQTQPYADWLAARLDYFDVAAEATAVLPAPPPPKKPSAPPPPATLPKPSTPPKPSVPPKPSAVTHTPAAPSATAPAATSAALPSALETARNRYAENTQTWIRKLQGRPAPARAAALLPSLKAIFREAGIPEELVWQAEAESSFNPAAKSPVGALGLFQFMPGTATAYGLSLSPADERLDPLQNARAAARYLRYLHERFGDWSLALAAYNCGEGRLSKKLRACGCRTFAEVQSSLPAETRMYVPKIDALVRLREGKPLQAL